MTGRVTGDGTRAMSITNPYKKRMKFDNIIINHVDEMFLAKIKTDDGWKVVDAAIVGVESCWNNIPARTVLLQLFKEETKFNVLIQHYIAGVRNQEQARAIEEQREPEDPFPFKDYKERFLKDVNTLKMYGLVLQSAAAVIGDDGTTFSLTDDGIAYTKTKMVGMIEKENFDVFLVMLNAPKKRIYFSHLLMKIAEQRKSSFDQILLLIDDLDPGTGVAMVTSNDIVRDYLRYLRDIEEERISDHDFPVIYTEVIGKVSKLIEGGLVTMDGHAYILTGTGDATTNAFIRSIASTVDFLNKSGLIVLENINDRYVISLTKEGNVLAEEIKERFTKNEARIANSATVMDDFDLHETHALIPVDEFIKQQQGQKAEKQASIYIVPQFKMTISERIRSQSMALVGTIGLFFFVFCIVGFALVAAGYADTGYPVVVISIMVMLISFCSFPASMQKTKYAGNKSEMEFIEEQFKQKTTVQTRKDKIVALITKIFSRKKPW